MSQDVTLPLAARKPLRLKKYDYSQCNAYFVTICTHNRLPLFGSIQESTVGATLCGRPNQPNLLAENWLLEIEKKYPCAHLDYARSCAFHSISGFGCLLYAVANRWLVQDHDH